MLFEQSTKLRVKANKFNMQEFSSVISITFIIRSQPLVVTVNKQTKLWIKNSKIFILQQYKTLMYNSEYYIGSNISLAFVH